jgi:coenzyme F420-reducing hydrogenase delta subunit
MCSLRECGKNGILAIRQWGIGSDPVMQSLTHHKLWQNTVSGLVKGATLSDVTALKEYGVDYTFIVNGISAGKLEYREGNMHGNSWLKVLRGQLEQIITEKFGADYLVQQNRQTELRVIKKEMTVLKKRLNELQARRAELEVALMNTED